MADLEVVALDYEPVGSREIIAGDPGVGIASATVDGAGDLTLTMTDGTTRGPWHVGGDAGPANTLTASAVTGAPGSEAAATITGESPSQHLEITVPSGLPGTAATVTVDPTSGGVPYGTPTSVTNTGTPSAAVIKVSVQEGQQGNPGTAATVAIDPTSGGVPHGTPTSVTNTGTAAAAILRFLIEQAQPGSQILTGTGTPTGTPPDGTLMLDTGNGNVWRYSGGAWSGAPVLNIMGPAGSPTPYELRGDGSPYGTLVPASAGIYYTDTAATCGAIRWVSTGTTNTSWIVTVGDTGWRDLGLLVNPAITYSSIIVLVRRVGVLVDWTVYKYNASGTGTILTVPGGFLAKTPPVRWVDANLLNGLQLYQASLMIASSPTSESKVVFSYTTSDPWPTALPGTPA